MKRLVSVGFALFLFACTSSESTVGKDSGVDAGKDAPTTPDTRSGDVADVHANDPLATTDAAEGVPDRVPGEPTSSDAPAAEASIQVGDAPVEAPDAAKPDAAKPEAPQQTADLAKPELPGADTDRGEARSDAADGKSVSEAGELCTCAEGNGPSIVPWSCFCSVESCARTLADFVGTGDGGKVVKSGRGTVLVTEYAGCNLVLVEAHLYSDYVPASQLVFDRTTGTLVGARVWLDDRQHACPFAASSARWVYGYEAGTFPAPTSCQATDCLAGTGTCPGARDAQ